MGVEERKYIYIYKLCIYVIILFKTDYFIKNRHTCARLNYDDPL